MRKILQILLLSILLGVLLSSCFQDPIDINLNENNKKLAIEAWINTLDEDQFVTLTRTANYLGSDAYETVSDATITLTDEEGMVYQLGETSPGKYLLQGDWNPVFGSMYTLRVEVENEVYTAQHLLYESPEIENLISDQYFNEEDSLLGYETVFDMQDAPGEGDAYYVIDYEKGSLHGDTLLNGGYADDEFFDGEYVEDIRISDEDRLFQIGDTAVVEVFAIGKASSQFLMDVELEVFRGGPFDPPPANVRTNFDGDVVGYFILSGANRRELLIQ